MIKIKIITKSNITPNDITQIAMLHQEGLGSGFLSQLGTPFLRLLYRAIAENPNSILVTALTQESQIIGFITGTTQLKSIYRTLIRQSAISLTGILLKKAFSPKIIKKILDLATYPFKYAPQKSQNIPQNQTYPSAELLSLVVHPEFRQKGVAQSLYKALVTEFRQNQIKSFKIVVGESLTNAQKFYAKMGAKTVTRIQHHQNEWSYLMIQDIQ